MRPGRIGVVVHPTRPVDDALAALRDWASPNSIEIVQVAAPGSSERAIAPEGTVEPGDLVVALGGDGTVLAALRASALAGVPVLGAACGSVGVLTAVPAGSLSDALERVFAGDWTARRLPALAVEFAHGPTQWAINDFVAVRRRPGQLVANVSVDGELYVRMAGDGLIVATALGSSAYTMAAGGPLLTAGTSAFVCTPVAMHGGNAPPIVVSASSTMHVELNPGFAGYDIEIDGHEYETPETDYRITLHEDKATLVSLGEPTLGLAQLRAKHLISDSARILARDARGGDHGAAERG